MKILFYFLGILFLAIGFPIGRDGAFFVVMGLIFLVLGALLGDDTPTQSQEPNNSKQEKVARLKQVNNQTYNFLSEMNLSPETEFYRFYIGGSKSCLTFFDTNTPYFLYATESDYVKLPLSCIIETVSEAKYISNKTIERQGTVKRAVIGGALAGGVGAIIGGTTGDSIVNEDVTLVDSWMRIQTNEVKYRTFIIHTPNKEKADDDVAIVKAIISKYGNSKEPSDLQPAMN